MTVSMSHPDFAVLTVSWELALRPDGYADNTVKAYQNAVRSPASQTCTRMRSGTPGLTPSGRPGQ